MNTASALPLPTRSVHNTPTKVFLMLACLVLACGASLLVAVSNGLYFVAVEALVHPLDPVIRAALFSSWLLLLGGVVVVWRPAAFGFRLGDIARRWRLIAVVSALAVVATALLLSISGRTPYSDASLVVETVIVPFTEELVFRGVLLTALLVALGRLGGSGIAVTLAVIFDGIAFGVAHLANATTLEIGFVVSQATFASVLGLGCAYLMVRTRSVFPAMLLHALVNAVVVLL